MSAATDRQHRSLVPLTAVRGKSCPACGGALKVDSKWCPSCNFTGSHSLVKFPDPPPPLQPILDAVGLWQAADLRKIEAARTKLQKQFPQLNWRICNVSLPPQTELPLFGFWLLNTCPLAQEETAEQRSWTILLLIDVNSKQATVVPGYGAETCLNDADWLNILAQMAVPWQTGDTATAVVTFFKQSQIALELAFKSLKKRRSH
jgi:TPM domain